MVWVLVFIFGLAIGSFINCLVYRLNTGKQFLWGRSFCDKCRYQLGWYDNIPLFSFVLLRGRCRYCSAPISWQYPLVELVSGLATVFVIFHLRGVPQAQPHLVGVLFYLLITYSLIAIFVSDLRYQTIPDEIVYPAILISLLYASPLRGIPSELGYTLYVIPVALGASLFFLALVLITRGKGMGMGDVKLAGLMGLVLGFPKIVVALCLAFLTGALVGVILVLIRKKTLQSQIPFGPFLAGATFIGLFWGEKIVKILGY